MSYSERIEDLLAKGVLVTPEMLEDSSENDAELVKEENKLQAERLEKAQNNQKSTNTNEPKVKVVYNYDKKSKKRSVNDFIKYFNLRFKALEKIIRQRPEMQGLTSINRVQHKEDRDNVSIIGMINDISKTKNDNIILTVEDLTGEIKVLVNKNNQELIDIGKDLVLDEVIGIVGSKGNNIIFSNNLVFPDISLNKELKKAPEEAYAVFISDVEVGAKVFLEKEFKRFINWINGKSGNEEQKRMAAKTKYVFIVGDLVAGVGIYPNQEHDLEIQDIKEQYEKFAEYIKQIDPSKKIIMCAGNHDAGRIAEPQPPIYHDMAETLWKLPNAIHVSNPSLINIESSEDFSGIDVLLYHGYSIIYYCDNIPSVRNAGGQKRVDLVLKFMLQRRHLAPTHQSNLYIPDDEEDPMVIDRIPDVLVTGHIHRSSVSNYRNVTLLNTSCWGATTENQEKRGLEPQPARAFVMNLQTRKVKVINFLGG